MTESSKENKEEQEHALEIAQLKEMLNMLNSESIQRQLQTDSVLRKEILKLTHDLLFPVNPSMQHICTSALYNLYKRQFDNKEDFVKEEEEEEKNGIT